MGSSRLFELLAKASVKRALMALVSLLVFGRLLLYLFTEERLLSVMLFDAALSLAFGLGVVWLVHRVVSDRRDRAGVDEKPPAEKFDQELLFLVKRIIEVIAEPAMLVTYDAKGDCRVIVGNKRLSRFTGYALDEIPRLTLRSFFTDSVRERILALKVDDIQEEHEVDLLGKEGEPTPVMLRGLPLPAEKMRLVALVMRDSRERRLREARQIDYTSRLESMVNERTEALLQTERQLINLMENMDSIVLSLDVEGKVIYVNPAWQMYLGYQAEQTLGVEAISFMHPDDADRFQRLYRQSVAEKINMSRLEFKCRGADGNYRVLSGTVSLIKDLDDSVEGSVVAMSDITDQRRMQEWIAHTERMESMGLLAGGLAHDFNNLFQEMMGLTRRIKRKAGPASPIADDADSIEAIVERATSFVRKIMSFASSGEKNLELFDINDSVRRIHDLVRRSTPSRIRMTLDLEAQQQVEGDATQFDQVFLNLILNARDAIHGEGEITLRTQDIVAEQYAPSPINSPGNGRYVVVECRDSGMGMTPEVRQRIFDPFFTTKADGRGTGLGLPTVFGIVRSHGGVISVESAPGEGALFTLLLPAKAVTGELAVSPEDREVATVLLVDDDRDIANLTAEAFQYEGYRVLVAYSGKEALETYQAFSREIDIVVMDKRMPEMDGLTAARQMRQINQGCKIVMSSGERIGEDHGLGSANTAFLEKPYQFDKLLGTVCRLIGRSPQVNDEPPAE